MWSPEKTREYKKQWNRQWRDKGKHTNEQQRPAQQILSVGFVVTCYWCNKAYEKGLPQCPECSTPYDETKSLEARMRSQKSYKQIAMQNARRDGRVEQVTAELKVVKYGGMLGRGMAMEINKKATAYLRKKGQGDTFFNNKRHKRTPLP